MRALFDRRGRWLVCIAGLLLPLTFAPFDMWFLAPLLLAMLFLGFENQLPREAAVRGFLFGFAAFAAGTYWLYISIHIFGQAPPWLAVVLMFGLVAAMAVYTALTALLSAASRDLPGWARCCFVWPAAWVLVEWLRGWLFTGFPWLSLGYGQLDGPLAGWAPVTGVYGVSLLVVMLAGALASLAPGFHRNRRDRIVGLVVGALAIGTSLSLLERTWTEPAGDDLRVSLIQGAVSQDRKWLPEQRAPTMAMYRDLTLGEADSDLVIWPEAAIPALDLEVVDYLEDMQTAARLREQQLLLGILSYERENEQYANTLMALGADAGLYKKRHLVPFGEFFPVPAFIRSWMRLMNLPYNDAAVGPRDQPPLRAGDIALAPSICYEDAFGAEQLDFLPEAGLLVNVSNDAWFGDSIAPHQHLQIARMRSLETGRYMLRATNTGITAIIGPDGGIRDQSPQFETHVLTGVVTPHSGSTPYIRNGNLPVIAISLLLVVLGPLFARRL